MGGPRSRRSRPLVSRFLLPAAQRHVALGQQAVPGKEGLVEPGMSITGREGRGRVLQRVPPEQVASQSMGCQVLRSVLRSGLAGPGSGSGGSSSSPDEVPCLKSRTPVLILVRLLPRLHTHAALAPTAPGDTAPRGRRVHPSHSVRTLSVLRISTLPRSRERIPTRWQRSSAMPTRCCRLCLVTSFPSTSIICSPTAPP